MRATEAAKTKDAKKTAAAVTTDGLKEFLSCGYQTAVEIGTKAGARIQIGRRVLWNVAKVQRYLDEIAV